jgi:hypothetical protein
MPSSRSLLGCPNLYRTRLRSGLTLGALSCGISPPHHSHTRVQPGARKAELRRNHHSDCDRSYFRYVPNLLFNPLLFSKFTPEMRT